MIEKIIKDGLIYTIPMVLSRGISFLLLPLYTRFLTPDQYGQFDLIMLVYNFALVLVTLEITQGLGRFISSTKKLYEKIEIASTAFWFTTFIIFSSLIIISVLEIWGFIKIPVFVDSFLIAALLLYAISQGIYNFMLNLLKWEMHSRIYTLASLLMTISTAVLTFVFLYYAKLEITGVILGLALGNIIGVLYALPFSGNLIRFNFKFYILRDLLLYSYPLAFSSVVVLSVVAIDRFILAFFLGSDAVGIYFLAIKISGAITLLLYGFRTAMTPVIYQNYENPDAKKEIAIFINKYLYMALLGCLGITIFSTEIVNLIAHNSYQQAVYLIGFLSLMHIFTSLDVFACGLGIAKKTYYLLPINLSLILTKCIFAYIFIQSHEAVGVAFISFVVSMGGWVARMYISQKLFYVPYEWRKIIAAISVVVIVVLGAFLCELHMLTLYWRVLIFSGCVILLTSFGLINIRELR